ncbi:MAG: FAD-binding oxidoreductase [Lachnospiraceae bacterium]|nr:FAD-binding oxidoreductase [Lachnospiraceae bacterium]
MQKYDRVIIGAGLYGLYAALYCGRRGMSVCVLEKESAPFTRATYVNQARVHMGYHYPRSLTTAMKSAGYFTRFCKDYGFCIHDSFDQIYATSSKFSWTDAEQFMRFCKAAGIRCDEVPVGKYFKPGMCDGAFLTEEYTYDAMILRDYLLDEIAKIKSIEIRYGVRLGDIRRDGDVYCVETEGADRIETGFLLNATYASVNEIIAKVCPEEMFRIKYELCEIILCDAGEKLKNIGITVMDGPFFSIMPFGKTGYHSLTSVTFTPHNTSYESTPTFSCQTEDSLCEKGALGNCNLCPRKPAGAWPYMSALANRYLKSEYEYHYRESLFSMKPILKSSEVDDSRPTAIRVHTGGGQSKDPVFISVLSGKINTVYDLDEYLCQ